MLLAPVSHLFKLYYNYTYVILHFKIICNFTDVILHICLMNKNLYTFYVAILENEVVCFDTNLKLFVEQFNKLVPDSRNYDWFYRQFKSKGDKFSHEFSGSKVYFFQKVV